MFAARFGGLPARFWWIWCGLLLNRAGVFVQPLLTFYLTQAKGFSLTQSALVASIYGGGAAVGSLLGGQSADRLGRRATLLISAFAGAAGLLVLEAMETLPSIGAAAFLLALCWDLHRPAIHAMVADLIPTADRVRAFGLQYVAVNLGFAIAPALAGWLAGFGYPLLFRAAAGVQLIWAFFVMVALPETRPHAIPTGDRPAGLLTALQDSAYVRFLFLGMLLALLPFQGFVALAAWMGSQGHSEATFGTTIALNGVLIVLVQPWIGSWVGKQDVPKIFMASSLLYGIGFALHGVSPLILVHALAVLIWTSGEILLYETPLEFHIKSKHRICSSREPFWVSGWKRALALQTGIQEGSREEHISTGSVGSSRSACSS
jgi:MFS family permease